MVRRVLTALLLLAVLAGPVYLGGIVFFALVAFFFGIASLEYSRMFKLRQYDPSRILTVGGVLLVLAARAFAPNSAPMILALTVLAAMALHLGRYETGRDVAALDFTVSVAGITYLGWMGGYLLDLRAHADGLWWLSLSLVTVWIADSAAYLVGSRFGSHKMSVRLSPNKSWEGYGAGVIAGTSVAALLGVSLRRLGILDTGLWQALGLGLVLSTLTTLGDLGESLFKRFAGLKDSGTFLPGHGGAFDRIDSLIWAGVLGYVWITLVV